MVSLLEQSKVKKAFDLIKQTFQQWNEDRAPRLAAALAFYTAFALAPVLVIALALVGMFYHSGSAQALVEQQMGNLAGPQGRELITTMLRASTNLGSNLLATVIGIVVLFLGATGVFIQLQDALNTMWEVQPKSGRGIWGLIRERLFSLGMVLAIGFLLLVSLLVSTALAALATWISGLLSGVQALVQMLNFFISLFVVTALFALLFKYVPVAVIASKDVWLGAFVTALLFTIGKTFIGLYLGNGSVTNHFGAAGALVVILLWVYYSAQIFFFGAEFTQVYANTYGSKVVPKKDAIPLTEGIRREQGIPHQTDKSSSS